MPMRLGRQELLDLKCLRFQCYHQWRHHGWPKWLQVRRGRSLERPVSQQNRGLQQQIRHKLLEHHSKQRQLKRWLFRGDWSRMRGRCPQVNLLLSARQRQTHWRYRPLSQVLRPEIGMLANWRDQTHFMQQCKHQMLGIQHRQRYLRVKLQGFSGYRY